MLTVLLPLLLGVGATAESGPPGFFPVESYPLEESVLRSKCTVGARRRFDYSQCAEYEECVASGHKKKKHATEWVKKKCFKGYAFNDATGNCERDERCAIVQEKCSTPFIRLSCGELLVCAPHASGAYVRTSCADGFRNDFHSGCVADARCSAQPPVRNDTCVNGVVRPTANCRTFARCEGGEWARKQCREAGVWNEWCSECDPYASTAPKSCADGDTRLVNRTEERRPFAGYGIDPAATVDCARYERCAAGKWTLKRCEPGTGYDPAEKKCTVSRLHEDACNPPLAGPRCDEGARIIPPHVCDSFLQCSRGEWRQMTCPIGSRFDVKRNRCVEGECKKRRRGEGKGDNGDAEYRRPGHHHHRHRDSSSSPEDFEGDNNFADDIQSARFFLQAPIELAPPPLPQFGSGGRLNGAPEPLRTRIADADVVVGGHRPGYLGEREPQPAHHHLPTRRYRPQPPPPRPQYPAPQPAYPTGPAPSYPAPSYPAPGPVPAPAPYPAPPGFVCEGDFKVADAFDAAFFYDCTNGFLKRRACPGGALFDPQRAKCLDGYSWAPDVICYEKQTAPTAYCGEYRICHENEWLQGQCPHDWAFINGQCDRRRTCTQLAPPSRPTLPQPVCAPGSVRPDFGNPLGYLECDYAYRWVQRKCERGGVFDKRISRCVYTATLPGYPAASGNAPAPYAPVAAAASASACYEGETRADERFCTRYEVCHSGAFHARYCPYGSGFDGFHCEQGHHCQGEQPGGGSETGACQESAGLNGYLPDRTDCAFFYQCAQGRWVRMPCAGGTHYSPEKGVCDHIGNVPGCGWAGPRPTSY